MAAATVLLCYAREDEGMAGKLKKHLSGLEHNGRIALWDYGNISPGSEWKQEIDKHLDEAQIILLLISASFLGSHYCYSEQMQRAIERHERREARVIPVILRPVLWEVPPLDKLQPLPDRQKPIIRWSPRDEGYRKVAVGLDTVVSQWHSHSLPGPTAERKALMANFDQLIAAVKLHMQPEPRALATANTLQQLSIFTPHDVTLADLMVGWRTLAQPKQQGEEPAVSQRRVTCNELAEMASQFTTDQGSLAQAIKTWHAWLEFFKNRGAPGDPRQDAMVKTFARELTELQEATR
ncbi:MAG: toll/interleukin-1 receptor domain-containing protein [Ktedonobacteraceae bacterium]|nr:toll/interleukin-1 receptor domain-containing protein [Ktedonobacteraceae bacterium]